jgi:phosphoglycolate phosphatase
MDAILLDIDGTLWDSTEVVTAAWKDILKDRPEIDVEITPQRLKGLFGKPVPEIAAILFPALSEAEQRQLIDECCRSEHDFLLETPGKIFDGVVDTIRELAKRYKVCIVSNCEAGYIELVMDALKIRPFITDFECPGYTGLSKGENCRLVMERNHFTGGVYVGDTQGDADACAQAGIPFVFCKYGFGNVDRYDYAIDRFSDLLSLF